MDKKQPLIGKPSAYAAHRKRLGLSGSSRDAVSYAIKAGRITLRPDGMLDYTAADLEWDSKTNRLHLEKDTEGAPSASGTFSDAQREHEWLKVQKAELELRLRREELLEKSQVKDEISKMLSTFKNKMLYFPGTLAGKVAPITDARECRQLIERAVREALEILSEYEPDAA